MASLADVMAADALVNPPAGGTPSGAAAASAAGPVTFPTVPERLLQPGEMGYDPNAPAATNLSVQDLARVAAGLPPLPSSSPAPVPNAPPGSGASAPGAPPAATPAAAAGQPAVSTAPAAATGSGQAVPTPAAARADKMTAADAAFQAAVAASSPAGTGKAAGASAAAGGGPAAPGSVPPAGGAAGGGSTAPDQAPAPKKTGAFLNATAGANSAITGTLGLPVDAATAVLNLVPRGINAATGSNIPLITNPVGGSSWLNGALGLIGADPRDVAPANTGQAIIRGAAGGAAGALLPGMAASKVAELAGDAFPVVRGMAQQMAAPSVAATGVAGGAAGAGGEAAATVVPEPLKPLANMVGQIGVGGLGALALTGGRVAADGLNDLRKNAFAPVSSSLPLTPSPLRQLALKDAGGNMVLGADGKPIMGTAGQFGLAAGQLTKAAGTDRGGLLDQIPDDPTIVPGSQPTLGQATGNTGVLGLERRIENTPGGRERFADRRTQQNTARLDALRNVEDPLVHADAARGFFTRQAAKIDEDEARAVAKAKREADASTADFGSGTEAQAGQAIRDRVEGARAPQLDQARQAEEAAQDRVARATDALGGADGRTRQQHGEAIRQASEQARDEIKARRKALNDAVDPDGTWAVSGLAARNAARQVEREIDPDSGVRLSADAQHWVDTLKSWGPTIRYRTMQQARQGIGEGIRTAMRSGTPTEVRQLQILKSGIDKAVDDGLAAVAQTEAPHVVAGHIPQEQSLVGRAAQHAATESSAVYTGSGRRIDVSHEIIDASRLTTSHDANLQPNPRFPAELQPRDRTRVASELQVSRMARNLQPERLGASSSAIEGAPIVGPDGVVESGNARTLAIRRAYAEDGPSAAAYCEWMNGHGVDVSAMREPMLVRRRTTELSPEERRQFTEEANASPALAMGAAERARVDAGRLSSETLDRLSRNGGDVASPGNREFTRAAVRDLAHPGEEASFATGDGALSVDGARRIRNALVARAYGDHALVEALSETGDENVRAFGSALTDAAGDMARLREGIRSGEVDPTMDITPSLVEAAHLVQQARAKGLRLADVVGQRDAFSTVSPEAYAILREAYGPQLDGRLSRVKLADHLRQYAAQAEQQTTAPRLFGENATPQQILRAVGDSHGGRPQFTSADPQSQGAPSARAANGEAGAAGSGLRGGQAGPEGAGPSPGRAGSRGRAEPVFTRQERPLAPNMQAADAAAAASARRVNLEYATRTGGTVGQIMRRGTDGRDYQVSGDAIPGRVFRDNSTVDELVKLVGQDEADRLAGEYLPYALRAERGMVRPDNTIDPKRLADWASSHPELLNRFPAVGAKVRDLKAAQADVADLSARRQALEKSNPLDRVDTNADVLGRYWQSGPRGTEGIERYAAATGGRMEDWENLANGAATSLRAAAMKNGEWDRGEYNSWMTKYAPALAAAPPQIRARFETFACAQQTVEDAQTIAAERVRSYQDSAASFYLDRGGDGVDPYRAIGRLLGSPNPNQSALDLMNIARADPEAVAGIRRNLVDFIVAKAKGTTEAGATGERELNRAAMVKQLTDPVQGPAIRKILTPEQSERLESVLRDMDRTARSHNATKIPGSPGTAAGRVRC